MRPYRRLALRITTALVQAALLTLPAIGFVPAALAQPVTISSIEITQGVQTNANTTAATTALLVANRSLAVRVTLGTASNVPTITGLLRVRVDDALLSGSPFSPMNAPFTAVPSPQRQNENHTLNFEISAPSGIVASNNVDFEVEITRFGTVIATAFRNDFTFVRKTNPTLYYTRIRWTPAGSALPALADIQATRGDAFVRGVYPIDDSDPALYRVGLFPTLEWSLDTNSNTLIDANGPAASAEAGALLAALASCRQLIVDRGLGATKNTFLYGWVAGNPINGNGAGKINGFVGFGNTEHARYQRTFAHELGHNFGQVHPPTGTVATIAPAVGWDVGARLSGNPSTNNVATTTSRVKPGTMTDNHKGGALSNDAWIGTGGYSFYAGSGILSTRDLGPDDLAARGLVGNGALANGAWIRPSGSLVQRGSISQLAPELGADDLAARTLVVQGIFADSGDRLLELPPAFRFPWLSQPTLLTQQGPYAVEVIDTAGTAIRRFFDAMIGDDSDDHQGEVSAFFEVMVPVRPDREVASVRVTDASGDRVFGALRRSAPPQIEVVEPLPGSTLGEQTRVSWRVLDPDTPAEEVRYQVAYSPDGGQSWVPVAVNIPGTQTSIVLNSMEIQRSAGRGALRVFVSDGVNTAFADAVMLTPASAQFPFPRRADLAPWLVVGQPTRALSVTDDPLWVAAPGEWYQVVLVEDGWALAVWVGDGPEWSVWIPLDERVEVTR